MCSAPLTALQIYILFRLILNKHKKSFIFDDECLMLKYMKHNIIRLDIVDSTNNEAKRRIDSLADLDVIAAFEQTAGTDAPALGYTTVYPLAMFLRIITAQVLILILG